MKTVIIDGITYAPSKKFKYPEELNKLVDSLVEYVWNKEANSTKATMSRYMCRAFLLGAGVKADTLATEEEIQQRFTEERLGTAHSLEE